MSQPSTSSLLLCALVLLPLAMQNRAEAQCDSPVLSIHVDSIFARVTGSEIDQRLGRETGRLQALFDYGSYRLLRSEEADTSCGQEVAFILPVQRVLHVRPLATHGNSVALDLALFAGARALMRQQLKIWKGGLLVFVVSQNPQDAYITSLTVDTAQGLSGKGPSSTASAVPSPWVGTHGH
jgi:hypothetical protein